MTLHRCLGARNRSPANIHPTEIQPIDKSRVFTSAKMAHPLTNSPATDTSAVAAGSVTGNDNSARRHEMHRSGSTYCPQTTGGTAWAPGPVHPMLVSGRLMRRRSDQLPFDPASSFSGWILPRRQPPGDRGADESHAWQPILAELRNRDVAELSSGPSWVIDEGELDLIGWREDDLDGAAVLESQREDGIKVAQQHEAFPAIISGRVVEQLAVRGPALIGRCDHDGGLETAEVRCGVRPPVEPAATFETIHGAHHPRPSFRARIPNG